MVDERSVLRWVSWRDCCPWLLLFRTFSISISPRALLLATVGTVLVSLGWWILGLLLFGWGDSDRLVGVAEVVEQQSALPGSTVGVPEDSLKIVPERWKPLVSLVSKTPVYDVWRAVSEPFVQFFMRAGQTWLVLYYLLGGIWTLAVWAFFGGALSRIGVVQLGREERVGLVESTKYARKYFLSYWGGPLFPLVVLLLLAIPIFVLGLIMRADIGFALAGILWFLVILDGLIMALLGLGILFGWPLMWGTISTEGSDSFDALSRCFAYTFQRPLQYAFYVLVAALFGGLCWLIVSLFTDLVVNLTFWAAAWGAGESRIALSAVQGVPDNWMLNELRTTEVSGSLSLGIRLILFWVAFVRAVAASWSFAFFFVSMAGVYLLIRRDVDQTETDEVYLEEGDDTYGMPPFDTDEAGVPKAADVPQEGVPPEKPAPNPAPDDRGGSTEDAEGGAADDAADGPAR